MRKIALACCFGLLVAAAADTAPRTADPAPVAKLELAPLVGTTTPGGPEFCLHVSVRNIGQHDLVVGKDLSWTENAFAHLGLGLRHKDGKWIGVTVMVTYGPLWPDWYYWTRVAAGNSYGTDFRLDRITYPDLYKPGEYVVTVTYNQRKWTAPAVNINFPPIFTAPELQLKSNEVTIVTTASK
jgi:hypothetical protein